MILFNPNAHVNVNPKVRWGGGGGVGGGTHADIGHLLYL